MARTHLTLAALATSAVAGLDVVSTAPFGRGDSGDYDSALLTTRDGRHWIVRVPRSERAEAEQSADLVALRALSAGVRARLPFALSRLAGQAPYEGTRAVVYEFVYGSKLALASLTPELAASVGRAVAAVHALPTSIVADAGLPVLSAIDCLRASVAVIDRASASGLVPGILLERWEGAAQETALWQFQPTVVNGSLAASSFLYAGSEVTGVLGWHELRVGDPARDLSWLVGTRTEDLAGRALDAYVAARGSIDRHVRRRARLHSELEVAKWLLHGLEVHSTEIVDDAVAMLSGLADRVESDVMHPLGASASPAEAGPEDVQELLERSERVV